MVPILLLGIFASGIGIGLVVWQPPVIWTDNFANITGNGDNAIIGITGNSSVIYSAAYANYSGIGSLGGQLLLNRHDTAGQLVWTRNVGNSSSSIIGISVGTDGVYVAGDKASSPNFVRKFGLDGVMLWNFNSNTSSVQAVSAGQAGVYVVDYSTIHEYDTNGKFVWASSILNQTGAGKISNVYAYASEVYVAGWFPGNLTVPTQNGGGGAFLVKYGLNNSPLWIRQFGTDFGQAYGISVDNSGVYVSGTTYLGPLPGFAWLRKYDFNGNLIWSVRIDSPDGSGTGDSSVSASPAGVFVCISTVASHDYLMGYDSGSGRQLWSFQLGTLAKQIYGVGTAYRLFATQDALYVAGSMRTPSYSTFGFISRVSPNASLIAFGVNPPWSFVVLGGAVSGVVVGFFFVKRMQRLRKRPARVGPSPSRLPTTDYYENIGRETRSQMPRTKVLALN